MIFQNNDRIVFAGDSVTDMGSVRPVGEGLNDNLGRGYVRIIESMLATYYPELNIRITNSGISGNTSRDLVNRFERDVVALSPDYVSICIGINDVWRQFDSPAISEAAVNISEYRNNLEKMITTVKESVKGIFLLTPYYMEPNQNDWMRKKMNEYSDVCRQLAQEYQCILVDFQQAYDHLLQFQHSARIAWDRVHPNQIGSTLMAKTFLEQCGFDYHHISKAGKE